jgi:hypothetical protein
MCFVALVGGGQERRLARLFVIAPNVLVVVAVEEGDCVQPILVIRSAHLHKRYVAGILHLPCELQHGHVQRLGHLLQSRRLKEVWRRGNGYVLLPSVCL